MPESKRTALEEAVEREKDRAATLQQELDAARQHIATLKASEARVVELESLLAQEKERSALTTGKLGDALRRIEVLESRTKFAPGTVAFRAYSLAAFGPPIDPSHAGANEASVNARDQAKAEAATVQPLAQDPGLEGNFPSQMQAPELTTGSNIAQKEHPSRRRVATPVRKRVALRAQGLRSYSQARRFGSWTGYKGGYGNARGLRTINGPGIW
jgi:hypothetical protein